MLDRSGDLWVFGYGSLMWRPGFPFLEQRPAILRGAHRSLCVYSHVHRGTPERPGLVLGLDQGGSCRGVAFRVAAAERENVLTYLRAREQVTAVYREIIAALRLIDSSDGEVIVPGLAYRVDRRHPQYAGQLDRETILRLVCQGEGISGHNRDYVINTHAHLAALGIHDPVLDWLAERLIPVEMGENI